MSARTDKDDQQTCDGVSDIRTREELSVSGRETNDEQATPDRSARAQLPDSHLTGIVLAGGLSTRMGKDKAAIHLFGEQEPDLLARTCRLLHSVTDEVWVSGRSGLVHKTECLWLPDEVRGIGPIAGIMSALRAAQGPVLVLSCDLPFMERPVLEQLIAARNTRPEHTLMTTFVQEETGFIEALVSIYELSALHYIEQAIGQKMYKINSAIPKQGQHTVPYCRRDSLPFFNVNYPADLEMARRIITSL